MTVRDLYNWCKDMIDDFFPLLLIITFVGAIVGGIVITAEHCPTCGVVLYDGSNYCHKCGTPVSDVAIKLENAKKGGDL